MNREQTKKLLMIIQAAFPNFHPQDKTVTIDTWLMMLEPYDYGITQQALKAYISGNHEFAPSVGQLTEEIYNLTHPEQLDASEAWAMVSHAISRSAYFQNEEFEKLPALVQKAVGSPRQLHEWALMESDKVESVIQSHFLRNYGVIVEREKQYEKLPADVKQRIEAINTPVLEELLKGA